LSVVAIVYSLCYHRLSTSGLLPPFGSSERPRTSWYSWLERYNV